MGYQGGTSDIDGCCAPYPPDNDTGMRVIVWMLWLMLGLSITIPVWLLSMLVKEGLDIVGIVCSLFLLRVIADLGHTFITRPPSKVCK